MFQQQFNFNSYINRYPPPFLSNQQDIKIPNPKTIRQRFIWQRLKGLKHQTKQIVAIKRLKKKYGTWQQCLQLSQVKALRKMNHPNIIKLKQVIRVINEAYFVFEYIQRDLYKLMTERRQKAQMLEDHQIRSITKQLVQALLHIHKEGFFHRDMKPQNILIGQDLTIKIIDFGIARQIRSKPPFTQYISTRWYRAPELLFRCNSYSPAIDVFALGCSVAEMYLNRPIFLGHSQIDQINKIVSILGTPVTAWADGLKQATMRGINIPEYPQMPLATAIHNCQADALNFISQCLKWDPSKRIATSQMINHPYLTKQISQIKNLEGSGKKTSDWDKTDYRMQRGDKGYSKVQKNKKSQYEKDEEFDLLLNEFMNYQINGRKEEKDDDELF